MIVQIRGKQHRQGVSKKTGNQYDFWEIHYFGPRRGVTGEAAITKIVDPGLFDFEAMMLPGNYAIECDDQGDIVSLAPATKA